LIAVVKTNIQKIVIVVVKTNIQKIVIVDVDVNDHNKHHE